MKKVLLFGANGQVGSELRRLLSHDPEFDVVCATTNGVLESGECEKANFLIPESVKKLILEIAPDLVINAAAYTAVDRAESESENALLINAETPRQIAEACSQVGIPMIHYSTDYVFDGESSKPYQTNDVPNPQGEYGRSKRIGEDAIRHVLKNHFIFRTAWVYGMSGKNFLKTMLGLADRDVIKVVDDQIGSPTPSWLIASVTVEIIKNGLGTPGTYHLVCGGRTSWADFAESIFEEAQRNGVLDRAPIVVHITTADYPTPAQRPQFSVLDTSSLSSEFAISLPDWRESLAKTFENATAADLQ